MTPEWIVLTDRETGLPLHFAASQITYGPRAPTFDRGCDVWTSGAVFHVCETEAQIMALLGMWPREPQPPSEPSEAEIDAAVKAIAGVAALNSGCIEVIARAALAAAAKVRTDR